MKIEMGYYEVIEALEAFLEKKHNVKVALEETELYIEYQKVIYKPLRYKNGKVKRHPEYGYPLDTVDRYETVQVPFDEMSDLQVFID
tara:strand:- start:275 stop:535 length:261 start_codon:yes stop_codon:yes gene_type:complete